MIDRRICDQDGMLDNHILARFLIELNKRRAAAQDVSEPATCTAISEPVRPKLLKAGRFAS